MHRAILTFFCAFAFLAAAAQSEQTPLNAHLETAHSKEQQNGIDLDLDERRLIQFSLDSEPQWMTERQKFEAKSMGWDFMDITETPFLGTLSEKPHLSYPSPNSTIVARIFSHLSKDEPRVNLEHLTSYHTRYYQTETGREASEWLYAKILTYTAELASEDQQDLISIEHVDHPWKQKSIVVSISPPDSLDSDPVTIIGAHIDSINQRNYSDRAPGAGDDGSGTVTILEAYRALLVSGYIPVSPLEFHFYAGEEGGLLGSQWLASRFESEGKVVRGMIQFDMTAYHNPDLREEIAVITNESQVDEALTDFLTQLIDQHLDIPWVKDAYPVNPSGRGPSSDHSSWKKAGYPSCHTLEAKFKDTNPNVHTPNDRIDVPGFSFDHMLHFSKLAVAFAVELSSY
ncbi:peptide hydrolase [Favolaschia claudopus]|uniref:Peptide hydrolase n=1 Tax=Favolaschia claudopus TaxID=2862362 RepID=A0AAW0BZP2_9AGAR